MPDDTTFLCRLRKFDPFDTSFYRKTMTRHQDCNCFEFLPQLQFARASQACTWARVCELALALQLRELFMRFGFEPRLSEFHPRCFGGAMFFFELPSWAKVFRGCSLA
jgi:hypothetical protein